MCAPGVEGAIRQGCVGGGAVLRFCGRVGYQPRCAPHPTRKGGAKRPHAGRYGASGGGSRFARGGRGSLGSAGVPLGALRVRVEPLRGVPGGRAAPALHTLPCVCATRRTEAHELRLRWVARFAWRGRARRAPAATARDPPRRPRTDRRQGCVGAEPRTRGVQVCAQPVAHPHIRVVAAVLAQPRKGGTPGGARGYRAPAALAFTQHGRLRRRARAASRRARGAVPPRARRETQDTREWRQDRPAS